jgi:hypothetical protein
VAGGGEDRDQHADGERCHQLEKLESPQTDSTRRRGLWTGA